MLNKRKLLGVMAENDITQRDLALVLGLTANTVSKKINGMGYFDTEQIDKICKTLHIQDNDTKATIFLG